MGAIQQSKAPFKGTVWEGGVVRKPHLVKAMQNMAVVPATGLVVLVAVEALYLEEVVVVVVVPEVVVVYGDHTPLEGVVLMELVETRQQMVRQVQAVTLEQATEEVTEGVVQALLAVAAEAATAAIPVVGLAVAALVTLPV